MCVSSTTLRRSPDVVAREIDGDLIIVPLISGIGDLEDELYSLNPTGRAIWDRLDGSRTLGQIAAELARDFEGDPQTIECDVVGLADELLRRGIVEDVLTSNPV
jgi:hypothetical protein